jgi:hypothetical protein
MAVVHGRLDAGESRVVRVTDLGYVLIDNEITLARDGKNIWEVVWQL